MYLEFLVRKFKRRNCFVVLGFLSAVFAFLFYFIQVPSDCSGDNLMCSIKIIKTIFVMIARGLVCMSLTIMYVYFAEIFPTSVKSIGILIVYASGSFGYYIYCINLYFKDLWLVLM